MRQYTRPDARRTLPTPPGRRPVAARSTESNERVAEALAAAGRRLPSRGAQSQSLGAGRGAQALVVDHDLETAG